MVASVVTTNESSFLIFGGLLSNCKSELPVDLLHAVFDEVEVVGSEQTSGGDKSFLRSTDSHQQARRKGGG